MWDETYSVEEYVYGKAPNGFLFEMCGKLKKGKVLCLAEGEGRNAVHLARQGFTVTAVDSSKVGLAKANKLARESGVSIQTVLADLADYTIEEGAWDSIVSIFCHLHPDLRRRLHKDVVAGLKKGGTFLLEAYTPKQLEFKTGGPRSAEYLVELAALKEDLDGLEVLHGEELVRDVTEGSKHTGQGSVVQLLARKN
ncbi:MAG: class I SAM-dependent methyltransferase [Woeseiaceae bacterium]